MRKNSPSKLLRLVSIIVLLALFFGGCTSVEAGENEDVSNDTPPAQEQPQPPQSDTEDSGNQNSDSSSDNNNNDTPPPAPSKKRVALTFDDGPHNVYTKKIVDALAQYGAHATFFVVGNRVDGGAYNGRAGIEYAIANGHEIGIHGYTHTKYYNNCSDTDFNYELSKTFSAIGAVSPTTSVKLMRPIGGAITEGRVDSCPYAVIMWNVDSEDWKNKYSSDDTEAMRQEKAQRIADNVLSTIKENGIILMHDIYESTYDALLIVLDRLYAQGYEVVTVSELLGDKLKTGEKYYSGQ